ncbi:putative MFS-type transporter YusP [Rhypophila sp. PSN 637]
MAQQPASAVKLDALEPSSDDFGLQQLPQEQDGDEQQPQPGKGLQFWGIIVSMQLISMLSALDTSVVSTALPSILDDLGKSEGWVWIANAYFLTMTAFQPLFGQASNVFGRRYTTLLATLLFAIGSAVCGSARNLATLIAGRAIQGAGGGAISILIEINVADLVPLRQRPQYMSIILLAYTLAVCIGPVVGGVLVQRATWRWVFWLNLPVCAVALVVLFIFLRTKYRKDTVRSSIKRVDLGGNALLVASVVAVFIALTWGGTQYAWSSWRTLVPLVLGLAGIGAFLAIESTRLIPEPTMPLRLFSNCTSLGAFAIASLHTMLTNFLTFFLPVYFQGVLGTGAMTSGVNLLPLAFVTMPFAIGAGIGTTKFGRYRPFFFIGMALLAICFGLLTWLTETTSTAYWAGIECLGAAGLGVLTTTTWPAVQPPLEEVDRPYQRRRGGLFGVLAVSGALSSRAPSSIRALTSWLVAMGFALLGFLVALIVKDVPLREELDTEYGLEVKEKKKNRDAEIGVQEQKTKSAGGVNRAADLSDVA